MNKQTQNLLLIGGSLALLYYLYTQNSGNGANAETAEEAAQSGASTLSADLESVLGSG